MIWQELISEKTDELERNIEKAFKVAKELELSAPFSYAVEATWRLYQVAHDYLICRDVAIMFNVRRDHKLTLTANKSN